MAHILLATADPYIADLLTRSLARCGHTTSVADGGLAALWRLEQHPFELLISDLALPRFAGAALVRVLAARPQRPRILVVSGDAIDPQTRAMADGLLATPFGAWEVATAVPGLLAPDTGMPALSERSVAERAYALG